MLRAMVVHLHRDGLAGEDADFLHPIANALADDRRRAPAVVHRRMLVRLLAAHPAEALDDRLHLLRRALPRDDDDIIRLDEQEIIEPDARDQAVVPHDQRVPAIEREHIALHRIAVRVVRQDIIHRVPRADIVPIARQRHHAHRLRPLRHRVIDRDLRHLSEMRHRRIIALREQRRDLRLIPRKLPLHERQRKGKHPGIPIEIPRRDIALRRREIWFLLERLDNERRAIRLPRLDIAIPRLRRPRRDAERHETPGPLLRHRSRLRDARREHILRPDHMIRRRHHQRLCPIAAEPLLAELQRQSDRRRRIARHRLQDDMRPLRMALRELALHMIEIPLIRHHQNILRRHEIQEPLYRMHQQRFLILQLQELLRIRLA